MKKETETWEALSGAYQLRPGHQRSIVGRRPILGAGRLGGLLRGLKRQQVGATLGSVFNLCAHAHRRTADLALAAAAGTAAEGPATDPAVLLVETARDHLRTLALDWSERVYGLPAQGPDLMWLRGSPVQLAGAPPADAAQAGRTLAGLRDWLEQSVLQQPAGQWLARYRQPAALSEWCAEHAARLPPVHCLAIWHPLGDALTPPATCLDVLDDEPDRQTAGVRLLAQAISGDPGFVQRPLWNGQCAENGPWARLRHRRGGVPLTTSVWTRLTSRWIELVEIAAAAGHAGAAPMLASGALPLATGEAVAWCEMARGLLFHWVRLDGDGAVADYRVLAPTEWNFHPAGTLARCLAALATDDAALARTLAAAFDPCVSCTVVTRD